MHPHRRNYGCSIMWERSATSEYPYEMQRLGRWEGCVALVSKLIVWWKVLPRRHTEEMNWSFPIRDCNCCLVQCLWDDHILNMCRVSVWQAWSMRDSWAIESNSMPRRIKFLFGWNVFSGLVLKPSSLHILSITSSKFWLCGEEKVGHKSRNCQDSSKWVTHP